MESQDGSTGAVNCSGSLSLDLPPGVAVVGGRRTLTVGRRLHRAARSGRKRQCRAAAQCGRGGHAAGDAGAGQPSRKPRRRPRAARSTGDRAAPDEPSSPRSPPTRRSARSQATPAAPELRLLQCAHERRNCGLLRQRASPRSTSTWRRNTGRAIASASPEEKALLQRTRDRFLGYRDRCPESLCIGDAYVGRMKEIRDIMEGRWQPRVDHCVDKLERGVLVVALRLRLRLAENRAARLKRRTAHSQR